MLINYMMLLFCHWPVALLPFVIFFMISLKAGIKIKLFGPGIMLQIWQRLWYT